MNKNNLELATTRARMLAFVIDDFLITFIIIAIYWSNITASGNDLVSILIVMNEFVWQILILKFIYQSFFVWYYGATIGKIITKIRIIDYNDLGSVSLSNSLVRSMLRIISEMFFYIGFIFAFFTEGRQTFHDKLARTLVVNV